MSWRALYVIGIARALQQRTPLRTAARKRTAAALAATETTDDYGILQQEMERGGASFTDCRIAPCGGTERAIVATAAHAKGSVLIRVPRALAITSNAALAYASGAAAKTLEGASDGDLLAVWLLEQDASSEFIKSLPTVADLAHLPVFWAGDDLALLAYSDVGRRLGGRVKSDDAFHAELRRVSPDYAASDEKFRRTDPAHRSFPAQAKAIVASRAFSMPGDGPLPPGSCVGEDYDDAYVHGVSALIPLVDMINHVAVSDGASCEWGVERLPGDVRGDFVVRALRDIEPGEMSISYGDLSAAGSLLNYGFLGRDAASSQDCATVSVSLDARERSEASSGFDVASRRQTRLFDALPGRSAKRSLWFRDEDLHDTDWARGERRWAATIAPAPVSWRNERAAMERLDDVATEALRARENLDAERGGGNVNARNAAIAADVETEILVHWQTLARRASYVLDFASDADDAPSAFDVGMIYAEELEKMLDSPTCFPKYAPPTAVA
ncbi:hypothetical protein JL722_9438 [Aureococcus anophagefferens]|nr:hypothetical protein JL722_9438 [Aureococcus anophagefferens]